MSRNLPGRILLFSLLSLLVACKKNDGVAPGPVQDAALLSYKFKGYDPSVTLDASSKRIEARFPGSVLSGDGLIAEFQLSVSATATVDGVIQSSAVSPNDFDKDIYYQLKATGNPLINTWRVIATNNDHSYGWGLGHFIKKEVSNNRSYEWYYDQGTTGTYSSVNCGPCSATMGIKWSDASFSKPPEYARNFYGTGGGWWFTNDILSYLNDNGIPRAVVNLGTTPEDTWNKITRQLDFNRVVILCLDANYLTNSSTTPDLRVDKFYGTSFNNGHFIVVKGYREVDHKRYFEVYDPNSWGQKNADDGTLKGRGRYYRYNDIYIATSLWWNFAITINPKGVPIDPGTLRTAVDPATIPNAKGF